MAKTSAEFDIIVYGASGFTGRLIAEYLTQRGIENWAMAGRSTTKLAEVRDLIGAPANTPLIEADASAPDSLTAMCNRARVIITTVGPYQLYGNELVAACAATGTDYVDLCGEPAWMRQMIDAHDAVAKASGARIVFSCGFDSIPFDLGVWFLQQEAIKRFGKAAPRVRCRVRSMQGGASGGTVASLKATMAAAAKNPKIVALLTNPFALTPGFEGPSQPTGLIPEYDRANGVWLAPFVMAPINTKNVHRSNALLGHAYGADFVYDEMMVTTLRDAGMAVGDLIAMANPFAGSTLKPGEGPDKAARDAGFYDLLFIGEIDGKEALRVAVKGDRDPGYGSTSKMIAESALTLLEQPDAAAGVSTPGGIMAAPLLARLVAHAGLTFETE
ncbi:MAG: saccharopine dehydrogenase family protein [Sphingomonadaceae bacterium]